MLIALGLVSNLLALAAPIFSLQVFDRVLSSGSTDTLVLLAAIAAFLIVVYAIIEFLRARALSAIATNFEAEMGNPVMREVILQTAQSNQVADAGISALSKIKSTLSGGNFSALIDMPWAPMFLIFIYLLHPLLGAVAIGGTILLIGLSAINAYLSSARKDQTFAMAQASKRHARQYIRNAELIHSLGMSQSIADRWQHENEQVLAVDSKIKSLMSSISSISKGLRMLLQIGIMGAGAWLVLQSQLSAGAMIAASMVMGRALAPFEQAVQGWRGWREAYEQWQLLKLTFEKREDEAPVTELPPIRGDIAVEDLIYRVPDTDNVLLKGINFKVGHGGSLAVLGNTGSGKSTLLRLMANALKATRGDVRIDGAALDQYDREVLGKQIGYLPQSVMLLPGTVADNVARFTNANQEDVIKACVLAGIHEWVLTLENGYQTRIGEDGLQLSGGQTQLVGIARALFGDPSILILDEPQASLDSAAETRLANTLANINLAGTTLVMATHRSSLLGIADNALVIARGEQQYFGDTHSLVDHLNANAG